MQFSNWCLVAVVSLSDCQEAMVARWLRLVIGCGKKLLKEFSSMFIESIFFGGNAFTHKFTLQQCYLTHIWRCQIYLGHHQIWVQSEKFAIGLARHSWCHLLVITKLLADSGWTQPQIIIIPLFMLEGNTILLITPKVDCGRSKTCATYIVYFVISSTFSNHFVVGRHKAKAVCI